MRSSNVIARLLFNDRPNDREFWPDRARHRRNSRARASRESCRISLLIFTLVGDARQDATWRLASSCKRLLIFRRQYFAGDFRRRIDDEPAELALQLRSWSARARARSPPSPSPGSARPPRSLPVVCARRSRRRWPALRRSSSALRHCLRQDFLIALLRFGELLLDLLGVQQALRNALPALFQDSEDRLVGESFQEQRDDDEADDLREENPDVKAERLCRFGSQVAESASGGEKCECSSK